MVRLPPLAEQQRIVAKLDELMDLCDRLDARLEESHAAQGALLATALRDVLAARDAGQRIAEAVD